MNFSTAPRTAATSTSCGASSGELNDLFLLLCFMEAAALPNPATLYLLEVYPYLLEQFHLWHRRMGIEHSPIGSLPCC